MFKFTIRELLLLTLVVALGVGWWVRERQLQAEVAKSERWRDAVGVLESIMLGNGWTIAWEPDGIRYRRTLVLSPFQADAGYTAYGRNRPSTDLP